MSEQPFSGYGYCDYKNPVTNEKCDKLANIKISQGTKIETKCQAHFDLTHMTLKEK